MAIAKGVSKLLAIKKETTWGVAAGAAGAQQLRRVASTLSLKKQTYESAEIRSDYQVADFRHGVRWVEGAIDGEASPGSYQLPMAAILRKLFATTTAQTAISVTIVVAGSAWTVTRGAGSWITGSGFKLYDVVRLSVGTLNAANINKNLMIIALTTTVMTVIPLNGVALVAEGPITGCTCSLIGRKSFVPLSGHTDESFTVEHWHPDVAQSEQFLGVKFQRMEVNLPPTGMSNIRFDAMGKELVGGTSQYFSSPAALGTSGVLAAVNGAVVVGGTKIALLTGLSFTAEGNLTADPVVGSNNYPEIATGRVRVNGSMSVYFEDATYRNYFDQETEVGLACAFTASNSATADFLSFVFPRIKAGGSDKDDGEKSIIQTIPFTALLATTGGDGTSGDQTTLAIQDSLAV